MDDTAEFLAAARAHADREHGRWDFWSVMVRTGITREPLDRGADETPEAWVDRHFDGYMDFLSAE